MPKMIPGNPEGFLVSEPQSPNDKFSDRFFRYDGTWFLAQAIHSPDDIQKRSASFVYSAVEDRILLDSISYQTTIAEAVPIMFSKEIGQIGEAKTDETSPYWNNGFFSSLDARFAYAFIIMKRPKLIVEIGAGNSTKFFRKAIDDAGYDTTITAIDPNPRADISPIVNRFVRRSVIDADLDVFDELEPGDILSWDGSHIVFNGSDVVRLFLEVLPRIKSGVFVHVHDIVLPYEAHTFDSSYSEQYMLGTYLLNNKNASVVAPIHYLIRRGALHGWGGSFWFASPRF
jgi:hypothetical protein